MNPEIYGYVIERLLNHPGVHDAYLTSIMMKKGRPGTKLSVLAANKIADIARVILRETSTLGVRIIDCDTVHLEKEIISLETPWGQARVKVGRLAGQVLNVSPEYEDCKTIALKHNIPLKEVYQHMIAASKKLMIEAVPE